MNQTHKNIERWQNKLLPWFIAMPTGLIIVFIYLATVQFLNFNKVLQKEVESNLIGEIIPPPKDLNISESQLDYQSYIQWITLAKLEQESFSHRYKQGGMLLMSRIFTKYLGFFTGMILAIVGSVFIIGKIKEDVSELEGSIESKLKFRVVSSSPGIIFGVLGTILMLATILKHNEVTVKDQPLYLNSATISATEIATALDQKTKNESKRNADNANKSVENSYNRYTKKDTTNQ